MHPIQDFHQSNDRDVALTYPRYRVFFNQRAKGNSCDGRNVFSLMVVLWQADRGSITSNNRDYDGVLCSSMKEFCYS